MGDLKNFLLVAKQAITDLEIPIPGDVTGPVANPLFRIATQLAVAESKGKGLTLLRNVLLASAVLLCGAPTLKLVAIDEGDVNAEPQSGHLIADAVDRLVGYRFDCFRLLSYFIFSTDMNREDVEQIKRQIQKIRTHDAVKPLRLALMVSPIILLSTRLLHNTIYDKQALVQVKFDYIIHLSVVHYIHLKVYEGARERQAETVVGYRETYLENCLGRVTGK